MITGMQKCVMCGRHVEKPCQHSIEARGCQRYRNIYYGEGNDEVVAEEKPDGDAVTLPPHYTRFKIEPITFIMENNLSFQQGNIIKYVCRWEGKDGLQDLKKARRYLDMWIRKLEGDAKWAA